MRIRGGRTRDLCAWASWSFLSTPRKPRLGLASGHSGTRHCGHPCTSRIWSSPACLAGRRGEQGFVGIQWMPARKGARSARARRALTTTLCTKRVHVFAHDKRGAFLREIEVRTQRPSADKVCLCAANTRLRSRLCTRKSCGCPCLRRLQIAHVVQNELGWLPRRRGHAKREIVKQNVLFLVL
jgi:hypothetical protein